MADVAAKAGVSASTVCRALKSDPQIPEATRERVRAVAVSMGYSPDPLLSAFASRKRGRTKGTDVTTIAFVTKFSSRMGWRQNPYYSRLFDGAQARARQLGYDLENFWLGEPGMTSERMSNILYHRGISAAFIAPLPRARSHISLAWDRFSCITIGHSLLRPNLHRVSAHNFHGILTCVRELRRRGYKRIGFCVYRDTSRRVDDIWLAGFFLCQRQFDDIKLSYLVVDDATAPGIPAWCHKERVEVLIGAEAGILQILRRSKIFPDEIDYAAGSWSHEEPEIAGLDQLPDQIGATAVDLVIGQLQRGERGVPALACTTMVEGIWRPGESVRRDQKK
jgi:LacI family transcriptional regulator